MRDSSATEKLRLLNPWALLLIAIALGVVLWFSFQKEEVFHPHGDKPDEVSANYAELLLAAKPQNDELRLQLVELLLQMGQYERASKHLQAWPSPKAVVQAFYQIQIDVLAAQAHDTVEQQHQALHDRLQNLDYGQLPLAQLQQVASLALAMQAPDIAAGVYDLLAKRDAEHRDQWLEAAAKWHMASGEPGRAADIYLQFMRTRQDAEQQALYRQQAIAALLAAGRGHDALQIIEANLDSVQDPVLLEQAVYLAMSEKRQDLARAFYARWRALQSDTPDVLAKSMAMNLAFGDQDRAWHDGQALLEHRPKDAALLEQMARLGEWRDDGATALTYWLTLLQLNNDPEVRQHALLLAFKLFDFDRAIPLLADVSAQRELTDKELDMLTFAHESRGTPEAGEAWLRKYLRKYPKQRSAWVHLLKNLENTEQFAAKTEAYKAMSRQFSLNIEERVDWASTHLKLFDPKAAWQVLDVDTRPIKSVQYWQLRSAVAWDLELAGPQREALEKLLALKGKLDMGDESLLIDLYRKADPRKALALSVARWQRDHKPAYLVEALQMAQDQEDWEQVASLLKDADDIQDQPQVLAARGALAQKQGDTHKAMDIYRQGLERFSEENLFRERLMWLYVDANDVSALKPLVAQWRSRARQDRRLWLPMAAASQLLGKNADALAWYALYLDENSADWLVQSAYADALQAAAYVEKAQRLRLKLTRSVDQQQAAMTPQRYATWLRLLASSYSPRLARARAGKDQDGSPAMLQQWFERQMALLDSTNQAAQKDAWLEWARSNGLRIDRYEQLSEALRNRNHDEMKRLLAESGLDPAQRVEILNHLGRGNEALREGLEALNQDQPAVVREQLLRQNVAMLESRPQGVQLAWKQQDFGGLEFNAARLTAAHDLGDHWYANAQLEQGRYNSDQLDTGKLGDERNVLLTFQRQLEHGSYSLILDSSLRDDQDRHGLGISRAWSLGDDELSVGLDWHRKSEETGLMRALGQQDSLWVNGRHNLSPRDQVTWNLAQRAFSTRDGDRLGNGQAFKLEYNHTLQFEGPNWVLRSGVDYQRNSLSNRALTDLASTSGGAVIRLEDDEPLTPADLLQDRYGQLYVGSSWRRGFPGALNRTRPQYTWLVDTSAGWQWMDRTFNYGISTGIGVELLGDDELAVTVGYQSAPSTGDGDAGGTVGVSYSMRFGR